MTRQPTILCVLSDHQRTEYRHELASLDRPGRELVFFDDAEAALEQVSELDPYMVLVGMEVGPMEGLEFLAIFMSQNPDFGRPVVVLAQKDDPFPPMIHTRDLATGRSAADEADFDRIVELADEACAAPAAAAAPATPPAPASSITVPVPALTPTSPVEPLKVGDTPPRKLGPIIAVVAVVVLAAAGIGIYLALGSGEAPAPDNGAAPDRPDVKEPDVKEPDVKEPDVKEPDAKEPDVKEPDVKEPTPTPAAATLDLTRRTELPLTFDKASARPVVPDEARLASIVAALRQAAGGQKIEVGGHTSNEGEPRYNFELGFSRAQKARDLLVARGVPRGRLALKSYGGKVPLASNANDAGRRKNRRVTVRAIGR